MSEGKRSLEFYRGMLLAAEDAKSMGLSLQIAAFDEGLPETDIIPTLEKASSQSDVLVGFMYRNHTVAAGRYCEEMGKLAAYPMNDFIPGALRGNRSCLFAATTAQQFAKGQTRIATHHFDRCNIIYASRSSVKETTETDRFIEEMRQAGCKVLNISIEAAPQHIRKQLSSKRQNIVVTNTPEAAELKELLTNIKAVSIVHPEYKIAFWGSSRWSSYIAEPGFWVKNDAYVPVFCNPHTDASAVTKLRERYCKAFRTTPSDSKPSALVDGYDFGMMLYDGLAEHGTSFMLHSSSAPTISHKYHFDNEDNGCWTNMSVHMQHIAPDGQQNILELKNK